MISEKLRLRKRIKRIVFKIILRNKEYTIYKQSLPLSKRNSLNYLIEETEKNNINNYYLNKEIVTKAIELKRWNTALELWPLILNRASKSYKLNLSYINNLIQAKKFNKAKEVLEEKITLYPNKINIKLLLLEMYIECKEWELATSMWESYPRLQKMKSVNLHLKIGDAYCEQEKYDEAKQIFLLIYNKHRNEKSLEKCIAIDIEQKNWLSALTLINNYTLKNKNKIAYNFLFYKIMLLKILGNEEEVNNIYKEFYWNFDNIKNNKENSYKKITLYNNGETKIDYYKKAKYNNSVIITFDSLNMKWTSKPFAFDLLLRQDVDIVAVRKRRAEGRHQDLSREVFYDTLHLLINTYEKKLAYGYSLGGYTSLYYGSAVGCEVLSLAPRLSMHPLFGKKDGGKEKFKHTMYLPYNDIIKPIIVYDPKQKMDNRFIEMNVKKAYPNATLIKVPYGGHGIAPHLLRTGQLKEFILTILNEQKAPVYNKKLRNKSNIYLRVLAQACFNRGKLIWAKDLVEESLSLKNDDKFAIYLKIKILKHKKLYNEAIIFTKESMEILPKNQFLAGKLQELMECKANNH